MNTCSKPFSKTVFKIMFKTMFKTEFKTVFKTVIKNMFKTMFKTLFTAVLKMEMEAHIKPIWDDMDLYTGSDLTPSVSPSFYHQTLLRS